MKQSQLFGRTRKDISREEVSTNAQLLERGGFVEKLIAGVYSYLPLGLRVLRNIQQIIREEMDRIGGQELLMPALAPKELWQTTGRLGTYDALLEVRGANDASRKMNDTEYILGPTHEEVVTPLVGRTIQSYKDLPMAVYQIQTKFRSEPRAKSGLLRGRELGMKDMYSFHRDQADFEAFYQKATEAYQVIFGRLGLDSIVVEASGGAFTEKHSHEFQVETPNGEDRIFVCANGDWAQNREIATVGAGDACPKCGGAIEEKKSIEVGNIFPLETRYSDAFGLKYTDEQGTQQPIIMGCYGIGMSRAMGAIAEVHHDEKGLVWPKSVAPFQVHLISIRSNDAAEQLYRELTDAGVEVLYDDRDVSAGAKFADADLIGIPVRLVVSDKTLATDSVEWKERLSEAAELVKRSVLRKRLEESL